MEFNTTENTNVITLPYNNNIKKRKYPKRKYIINNVGWLNKVNQKRPSLTQVIKRVTEKRKFLLIKLMHNKKQTTFANALKKELINTRPLINYDFYEYLNTNRFKTVAMSTMFDKNNYLYYQFAEKSLKLYHYALYFIDKHFYNQNKIDNYCMQHEINNIPCKRYDYSICHYYNNYYNNNRGIFNIIIFGGVEISTNKYLNDLWILNSKYQWVLMGNNNPQQQPSPRKKAFLFVNNDNILTLMGGVNENQLIMKDCFIMFKHTWKKIDNLYPETYNKSNNFVVTNKNSIYNNKKKYILHFRTNDKLSSNYKTEQVWIRKIEFFDNIVKNNWKCIDNGYELNNKITPLLLKKKYLVYNQKLNITVLFGINKLEKIQTIWILNRNVWREIDLEGLVIDLMNILYAYFDKQTKYIIVIYKKYKSNDQKFYIAYFNF